jgi:hypothetical protein
MDFKFDAGSKGDAASQGQDKGRQTVLLVLLLLLLGGFGYLYFFTGLIRPQELPVAPQPVPQVVKQPLPARDGVQSQMSSAVQAATVPAPVLPAGAAKPSTTPAGPPSVQKPTAVAPVAAPTAVKPVAPADKPAEKKSVVDPKQVAVKPAQAAKVEPAKSAPSAKTVVTPQPAVKKTPAPKPVVVAKAGGPWTVVVGSYVLEETLAADMARLKAVGLTPVMTSGQRHMTTMHRLKYADYADRDTALQAVDLLKRRGGDGFVINKSGKHEVFAGSYAQLASAQAEQQRLAAAGVTVSIQKSQVGVPSRKLTAGTFTDRRVAESALKKVKQAGIGAPVLE